MKKKTFIQVQNLYDHSSSNSQMAQSTALQKWPTFCNNLIL